MPAIVRNDQVERFIRKLLTSQGFELSPCRNRGEAGVDIKAVKDDEILHIEVIGYKSSPPARAKDFYEVFFRAVSRLNDGAIHCIIALPAQFKRGLRDRVRQHLVAWERIGKAFPELEIWLVDTELNNLEKTPWGLWLETI